MKRIPKQVRDEAVLIAAIWASTPKGWEDARWSSPAEDLYIAAFAAAYGGSVEGTTYKRPYDVRAHETAAEAEALLRTGWSP